MKIRQTPLPRTAALAALAWLLTLSPLHTSGQVPSMISYQGRIVSDGVAVNGNGEFKFALVRGAGPTLLWKNDGSAGNTEPAVGVTLPVSEGLIMTLLGDTPMSPIPPTVFTNNDVRLRVWFREGANFQLLSPDQRIVSVGYAMMAGNVPDGSITAAKLAPGAVNPANFPPNSVGSPQVTDSLSLGAQGTPGNGVNGRLEVFATPLGGPVWIMDGPGNFLSMFGDDGQERARVHGPQWGEMILRDKTDNTVTVRVSAGSEEGGFLAAPPGGSLLFNAADGKAAVSLTSSSGGSFSLFQKDGGLGAVLDGDFSGYGNVRLFSTNAGLRARLQGGPGAGSLSLFESDGTETVSVGSQGSGNITLRQGDSSVGLGLSANNGSGGGGVAVYRDSGTFGGQLTLADNAGYLGLANSAGQTRTVARGNGSLSLYDSDGTETVAASGSGSGAIVLRQTDNSTGAVMAADNGTGGGGFTVYRDSGAYAAQLTVAGTSGYLGLANSAGQNKFIGVGANASGGAALTLLDSTGAATIVLDSDQNNEGRITTEVLTITGGSDLSESFDINAPDTLLEPGMIVSIDSTNPGSLVLANEPYDNKVAGIVSGAGGVKPGMLMGQRGTKADGKHPVALTGRVYCHVDASFGAVKPGDMITTSSTPGHGMKAGDRDRAFGAVIGKAMTSLEAGKGLVLVLVSLQ